MPHCRRRRKKSLLTSTIGADKRQVRRCRLRRLRHRRHSQRRSGPTAKKLDIHGAPIFALDYSTTGLAYKMLTNSQ
jgi:hypothetical protein